MNHENTAPFSEVVVGPADPQIFELEAALRTAQLEADTDALDRLISDDLLFSGPTGQLVTKTDDLESHRTGTVRIREHKPLEIRIRRVGREVAIVALLTRMTVEIGNSRVQGTFRYTRVWAEEGDAWRVVGGHVAPVGASPEGE